MKLLILLAALLLSATNVFAQATVTWTDNSTNETGFSLERSLNGGLFAVIAPAIAANVVTYTDTTAIGSNLRDNIYCYRVQAFNSAGKSPYSNSSCKTIPKLAAVPNAPSLLQVAALSRTQIQLSWKDNSSNELGFQAERVGNGETKLLEYAMNQTSATDSGLQGNTRYQYRLRALGDPGASAWTNSVKTKTLR